MPLTFAPLTCINCGPANGLPHTTNQQTHSRALADHTLRQGAVFNDVPRSAGIYIWGIKKTENGVSSFCPWYVGKHERDLQGRLRNHYQQVIWGKRELFDPYAATTDFYDCIAAYNQYFIGANAGNITQRITAFFAANQPRVTAPLLYFSNFHFWRIKHGITLPADPTQDAITAGAAQPYKEQIMRARNYIAANFCFTYATLPTDFCTAATVRQRLNTLENLVKRALVAQFGVYTSSGAGGNVGHIDVGFDEVGRNACGLEIWRAPGVQP